MVILINGSFGVGKTTVARLLRDALAGSVIHDPEWAGFGEAAARGAGDAGGWCGIGMDGPPD